MIDTQPTQTRRIPTGQINPDPVGIQPRASLNEQVLEHYTKIYLDDDKDTDFPAIHVWQISGEKRYRISDGYHRYTAARAAKISTINCVIHTGDMLECKEHALSANSANGLRMTTADRENGVRNLIQSYIDAGREVPSLRHLGKLAVVSHETVRRIQAKMGTLTRSADSFDMDSEPSSKVSKCDSEDWANDDSELPAVFEEPGQEEVAKKVDKQALEVERLVHDGRQAFTNAIRALGEVKSVTKSIMENGEGKYLNEHKTDVERSIQLLSQVLTQSKPERSCPYCDAQGCAKCNQIGWVCKYQATQLDKDAKRNSVRGCDS